MVLIPELINFHLECIEKEIFCRESQKSFRTGYNEPEEILISAYFPRAWKVENWNLFIRVKLQEEHCTNKMFWGGLLRINYLAYIEGGAVKIPKSEIHLKNGGPPHKSYTTQYARMHFIWNTPKVTQSTNMSSYI